MKRLLVALMVICAVQSVSAQQTKTKFNPALSNVIGGNIPQQEIDAYID